MLSLLGEAAPQKVTRSAQWPKNTRALAVVLRRIAPQLRNIGITVKFVLGLKARDIAISRDQHQDAADD